MEVMPYKYVSRNYLIKYYFRKKFLAEKMQETFLLRLCLIFN